MKDDRSNFEVYPHRVFASVILLDGKIVNFKTGNYRWTKRNFTSSNQPRIVVNNLDKVIIRSRSFFVIDGKQHHRAFTICATKFYKKFPLYKGYGVLKPY